jgi:hypothetical protein
MVLTILKNISTKMLFISIKLLDLQKSLFMTNNNITQISFSVGGFCFHLNQKSGDLYTDQSGCEWYKKGFTLTSAGGGYIYKITAADIKSTGQNSSDFWGEMRRANNFTKTRERHLLDRFISIHS